MEQEGNEGQIPKERLDESKFYKELSVQEPTWRELTASRIAYVVLLLFGVSLLVSFGFAFYVLACSPGAPPDEKLVDTSMAYLKAIGGIFTPLLAFILGYYFTKKEE